MLVKQSLVRVQGELSAVGLGAMYGSVGRRNATDAPTILIAEKRVITLDGPPFVISLGGKHRRVLKKTSSLGGVHRSPFLMSSVSNAVAMGQMQISVAKMQLENVEQQGRNALTLIHASAPPEVVAAAATAAPANAGPGVGERLNVVA